MNVEYVCSKISSVRWLHEDNLLKRTTNDSERFWVTGTYSSPKNMLSLWTNLSDSTEEQNNLGIYKLENLDYYVYSSVTNIVNYDLQSILVSLANGDILWLKYSRENGFELIFKFDGNDLFDHETSDFFVNDSNEIISSGLEGKLCFMDLNSFKISKTNLITSNSLHCLDKVSPNEVICGTTSGHIKLFDKRSQKVELSLANELSIITAIQRNTHIPHIVACGNDLGLLNVWDLRNGGQKPMQPASAHSGAINHLRYAETQPNLLFTSSKDAQLLKWNISNDFEFNSVESIIENNNYPINKFDINNNNQLVFADDNEVLYLTIYI